MDQQLQPMHQALVLGPEHEGQPPTAEAIALVNQILPPTHPTIHDMTQEPNFGTIHQEAVIVRQSAILERGGPYDNPGAIQGSRERCNNSYNYHLHLKVPVLNQILVLR